MMWEQYVLTANGFEPLANPDPNMEGFHPGIACDKTGQAPIVGTCYHLKGRTWDLCAAEYAKLPDAEKAGFEAIEPACYRPKAGHASPQRGHASAQVPAQPIVKACPAPAKAITDVWRALMQGKRPGPDPTARDGYGRLTLKAWLARRLAELSPEAKYALLRAAVSEYPPCTAALCAVLELVELQEVEINAYFPTSEGLYSLPALLLHNGGMVAGGIDKHAYIHTYMHAYIHTYILTCMHIYIYTYV